MDYTDADGVTQTVPPGDYTLDTYSAEPWIVPHAAWPATMSTINAVRVRWIAGAGCPEPLRQAILLLVAHFYANREAVGPKLEELPLGGLRAGPARGARFSSEREIRKMAVTYAATLKTTRMNAVVTAIDAGAGAGKLEIGTAGMALVLATITLGDPSATVSGSVLTLSGMPKSDTAADASGTAAAARIRDSNNADVVTGLTVGTSAADIILDTVSITAGQTVTINSGTLTHG